MKPLQAPGSVEEMPMASNERVNLPGDKDAYPTNLKAARTANTASAPCLVAPSSSSWISSRIMLRPYSGATGEIGATVNSSPLSADSSNLPKNLQILQSASIYTTFFAVPVAPVSADSCRPAGICLLFPLMKPLHWKTGFLSLMNVPFCRSMMA